MDPRDLAARAGRLVLDGDYEGALGLYERALELDGDDPDLWNGKGAALRGIGRHMEASGCFERALRLDPRDRDAS